jgi:hypothetical protein
MGSVKNENHSHANTNNRYLSAFFTPGADANNSHFSPTLRVDA